MSHSVLSGRVVVRQSQLLIEYLDCSIVQVALDVSSEMDDRG